MPKQQSQVKLANWLASLRLAATIWAIGYLAYAAIFAVAVAAGRRTDAGAPLSANQWDVVWFLRIARHGYVGNGEDPVLSSAFFPLYPLVVHLFDLVLPGGTLLAAMVVSALAYLGVLTVLHRLATVEFDRTVAGRTVCCLAMFPTAFFMVAGYNMSLAMLLVLGSVYALRRERWAIAAGLAALATATRSSAMVLLIAFGWEYLRRYGPRPRLALLAVAAVPIGLAGYAITLWLEVGEPLAFVRAQTAWRRHLDWPWNGILTAARLAIAPGDAPHMRLLQCFDLIAVCFVLAVLAMTVFGPVRMRRDQWVYLVIGCCLTALIIDFPSSRPDLPVLVSATRLVLEVFPVFMVMGRVLRPGPIRIGLTFAAVLLQAALLLNFLSARWVG